MELFVVEIDLKTDFEHFQRPITLAITVKISKTTRQTKF